MTPKRRDDDGRYSLADITRRIGREIDKRGLLDKEVAAEIGISSGQFSHKLRMTKRSRFNITDCSRLADYFKAPLGWPFLEWAYADSLASAADQLGALRRELEAVRHTADNTRKR